MEYAWLEPRHDPIATDTNLAEIDFEDFKNEDLAFAFSCGEEESGGSSTDMSICRSEALFSSMRDSVGGVGAGGVVGALQDSLCQDSLLVDGADFNYSEQIKVNKNNYTLTYSGHGAMGSFIASMVTSGAIGHHGGADENNGFEPPMSSGALDSPGKLITWFNIGKQQQQQDLRQMTRSRFREENTLNNNNNSSSGSSSSGSGNSRSVEADTRKSKSLPDIGRERETRSFSLHPRLLLDDDLSGGGGGSDVTAAQVPTTISEVKLVNAFFRGRRTPEQAEDTTVKDNFLRTASRLTSIEEAAAEGYSTASSGSSGSSGQVTGTGSSAESDTVRPSRQQQQQQQQTPTTKYPSIDFLENDVSLWDAFFLRSKTSGKFQSVLRPAAPPPPLPVEEYLRYRPQTARRVPIHDADSLRLLLPQAHRHLLPDATATTSQSPMTPLTQACQSMSKLSVRTPTNSDNSASEIGGAKQKWSPAGMVREAWPAVDVVPSPSQQPVVVRRRRPSRRSSSAHTAASTEQRNLNALNNNNGDIVDYEEEVELDMAAKRRSYHPQDYLSKLLTRSSHSGRKSDFPKSGSQNDLCDSWAEDEDTDTTSKATTTTASPSRINTDRGRGAFRNLSAEYPFHKNLCVVPQQGINFDLTHKRGLFVALYSAVERLLMYQDGESVGGGVSARCVLFQELCPALHAIMEDGLKPEVITSFGRMQTSVWRVVEAVTRQGGPNAGTTICDLVMLLNTKFAAVGDDHRKFAGFIAGLINMSTLHVWYTKLKWSMDVLLRFYERHSFICALHKETKLLFDELIFCLQRLYAINCQIDLPFNDDLLEDIPLMVASPKHFSYNPHHHQLHHGHQGGCVCGSGGSSSNSSRATSTTTSMATTTASGRKGSLTPNGSVKSRIPRPISLPKRLEAKLGKSPSPVRPARSSSRPGTATELQSPTTKGPVTPVPTSASARKSRVRDTIKLFDSKISTTSTTNNSSGGDVAAGLPPTSGLRTKSASTSRKGKSVGAPPPQLKSPKTGAGEAMALDSSGEHVFGK